MDYAELIQRARELTSKDDGLFLSGVFVPVEVPLLGALSDALQDARNELCLRCGKYRDAHNVACSGCSWSRKYEKKPVPGWTATPSKIKMAVKTYVESYAVTKCPEYVQDCEDSSKPRKFFTMAALLYDVAKKSDVEIGRALGVCSAVVSAWRHRTGRPAIAKGGRPKGEAAT